MKQTFWGKWTHRIRGAWDVLTGRAYAGYVDWGSEPGFSVEHYHAGDTVALMWQQLAQARKDGKVP